MSTNYASGLSPCEDKGICGIPEVFDIEEEISRKSDILTDLLNSASYVVVHTGAGISTSSNIPDFRGPNGVWTLEKRNKKPDIQINFEEAEPSLGHRALVALEQNGLIHYLITQNIDGLHLRSGFPRNRMSILHGDMFMEQCDSCKTVYMRATKPVHTMTKKLTGFKCTSTKIKGRPCRGRLRDTILDWEDELLEPDYTLAVKNSKMADLHICLGTSLQIFPAANLPFINQHKSITSKSQGKFCQMSSLSKTVIVNLQPTQMDSKASLCIRAHIDDVLLKICKNMSVVLPQNPARLIPGLYMPTVNLSSIHTSESEKHSWKVLSHPENESVEFLHYQMQIPRV